MRTLYGTRSLAPERFRNPVVTLGVFDGIHRGHRAVLARTREMAARRNGEVVVLTFDVHPRGLTVGCAPPLITSLEHRLALLAREGVDATVVLRFDEELRETSAEDFVEHVLLRGIGVVGVVLGHDAHFGHERRGDHALLARLLGPRGIPVERTEPVTLRDGTVVSSSAIREAVARCDLDAAARLLGRPPALFGRVVHGDGRGRALGFPTANLDLRQELRPGRGVYAGRTTLDGVTWPALVNIGARPTFRKPPAAAAPAGAAATAATAAAIGAAGSGDASAPSASASATTAATTAASGAVCAAGATSAAAVAGAAAARATASSPSPDPHDGADDDIVEVHILGLDADLYGRDLEVPLWTRLRDERRFESVDALRAQIAADALELLDRLADGTWSLA